MVYRKHTYMRLDGSSKISERRDMVADFQSRWVKTDMIYSVCLCLSMCRKPNTPSIFAKKLPVNLPFSYIAAISEQFNLTCVRPNMCLCLYFLQTLWFTLVCGSEAPAWFSL